MFQFIIFDLGTKLPSGVPFLLETLTKQNIPFFLFNKDNLLTKEFFSTAVVNQTKQKENLFEQKLQYITLLSKKQNLPPKDCLLITTSPTLALTAKEQGYICFGYTPEGSSVRFPSISLVLEGFDDISLAFLKREFAHAIQEPAYICETKRCDIKELPLNDIPLLYEMLQQEVLSYTVTDIHKTITQESIPFLLEPLGTLSEELEKHEAYIRYVYPFSYYGVWGIYKKETEQLIGRIGITEMMLQHQPEYMLEYFIHPNYRKCGYATECINAILHYVQEFETDTVCVCIHRNNIASLDVLSHCIFPYEELPDSQPDIRYFRIYLN